MSTKEKKIKFLKRVYFGVSDNPIDDVNPFSDLESFGKALVGTMNWGIDNEVIQRSKIRFAHNYSQVLSQYSVKLDIEDIFTELKDDKTNNEVVSLWADKATFIQ